MTGPDPGGVSGPGPPRSLLSDADRDRLTGLLREHYAQGRLSLEELRRRVGIVLAAEDAGQAAAALADLPPSGTGSGRPGSGEPAARIGQRRRHAQTVRPGPAWVPTSERFRDPSTKKIMRVWIDPDDHSRHYVPDEDG
ncbi:MAG TPA: DUF1707 domain-containing protein [Streptosporangiaceae bacterium]|nr:DUF1707 domain-containing protein [Streptosporangiaceae bacterium]